SDLTDRVTRAGFEPAISTLRWWSGGVQERLPPCVLSSRATSRSAETRLRTRLFAQVATHVATQCLPGRAGRVAEHTGVAARTSLPSTGVSAPGESAPPRRIRAQI